MTGGTGTYPSGTTVKQNPKPNLCTSGTPQLLKLTVTVSWGPNADANQVQDSVMINYPPFGVQTLGFLALQFSGDSTANDAQGNPWSERVAAIPVTFTGPQVLTLYPDPYGCVFAQVSRAPTRSPCPARRRLPGRVELRQPGLRGQRGRLGDATTSCNSPPPNSRPGWPSTSGP